MSSIDNPVQRPPTVSLVMGSVLLALLPAALASIWFDGIALAGSLALAIIFSLLLECAFLTLRGSPIRPFLSDLSAPLTAVLLVLALPHSAPWWMPCIGLLFALGMAKHALGGLGYNVFNPAMAGFAALTLLFNPPQAAVPLPGSWLVASLYVAGGLFLLWKKIIRWQVPAALLGTAALCEWAVAANANQPLVLTVTTSAPMLFAAFFIATDPVTGCWSARGRLVFGAGVAATTIALSKNGSSFLPFSILLLNALAPWLDQQLRPDRQLSRNAA